MPSHALLDQVSLILDRGAAMQRASASPEGDYIQAQIVRYCCLLTCAAIEQGLIDMASGYAGRIGDQRLERFVGETLSAGKNPSPTYILQILTRFDQSWSDAVRAVLDSVGEHNINSIVSNRNRIAHGQEVSISISSLRQWIPAARSLCVALKKLSETAVRNDGIGTKERKKRKKRSAER